MKKRLMTLLITATVYTAAAQTPAAFVSSDTTLQRAWEWAGHMVQHYQGNPADPVGPWYEAALPSRAAFCMRDVSHQTIGADIYGLHPENRNMIRAFAKHISKSKDWCSYWEINKYAKPAPEDYRNDTAFWYNLNANFDILTACWRLYNWTGDAAYINDPALTNFFDRTVDEYIRQWTLQPDSLLTRPIHPNAPVPFNPHDNFHICRGLPSYVENVEDLKMGIDLMATIYRGLLSYASIADLRGNATKAAQAKHTAEQYRLKMEDWWNESAARYYTWYNSAGKFGVGEGEVFLLWFDALNDAARRRKTIEHLMAATWNVETTSYLPAILYKEGYWEQATAYILWLTNPATPRREYPEVSFGVLEGIARGLMGVTPDAATRSVTTLYRGKKGSTAALNQLRVLNTVIAVSHQEKQTAFRQQGPKALLWKAAFAGNYHKIMINRTAITAHHEVDHNGNMISYVEVMAKGNKNYHASVAE